MREKVIRWLRDFMIVAAIGVLVVAVVLFFLDL